ncbi:MAG TPA: Tol-Pal system beta propeller repeat protein TolB [bacterium]|nr:Tol-Pal system beta propeller repeat protein TolB [bacterium]
MNRYLALFLAGLLILTGAVTASGETNVYLRLRGEAAYRLKIAVAPFAANFPTPAVHQVEDSIERVLEEDLRFTTLFDPLDNHRFIAETAAQDVREGTINFREWTALGADLLIKGEMKHPTGLLNFEAQLFDVRSGRVILRKVYDSPPEASRDLMHRFADDLVLQLTGAPGVAQTVIAYLIATTGGGKKELMIMDYDGHAPRQVTSERSIVLTPSWAPDGKGITFTSYSAGNPDLFHLDLASGKKLLLSAKPGLNTAPSWSPDGKRLALVLSRDGNSEIYTMDANGKDLRKLTDSPGINTSPGWSPNGREFVFTSGREGTPQIYLMDDSGKGVRRLSQGTNYADLAAWSPRGDRIAFTMRRQGLFDIFVLDMTSGQLFQLTSKAGNNKHPSWSPDGRHIVFGSTRSGRPDIYVMHMDGSGIRRLTFSGKATSPAWSPRVVSKERVLKEGPEKSNDRKGGIAASR